MKTLPEQGELTEHINGRLNDGGGNLWLVMISTALEYGLLDEPPVGYPAELLLSSTHDAPIVTVTRADQPTEPTAQLADQIKEFKDPPFNVLVAWIRGLTGVHELKAQERIRRANRFFGEKPPRSAAAAGDVAGYLHDVARMKTAANRVALTA